MTLNDFDKSLINPKLYSILNCTPIIPYKYKDEEGKSNDERDYRWVLDGVRCLLAMLLQFVLLDVTPVWLTATISLCVLRLDAPRDGSTYQINCVSVSFLITLDIHGSVCYIGRVITNFVLKFPNFRHHRNTGCPMYISTTPLNCLTLFGATFAALSLVLAEF